MRIRGMLIVASLCVAGVAASSPPAVAAGSDVVVPGVTWRDEMAFSGNGTWACLNDHGTIRRWALPSGAATIISNDALARVKPNGYGPCAVSSGGKVAWTRTSDNPFNPPGTVEIDLVWSDGTSSALLTGSVQGVDPDFDTIDFTAPFAWDVDLSDGVLHAGDWYRTTTTNALFDACQSSSPPPLHNVILPNRTPVSVAKWQWPDKYPEEVLYVKLGTPGNYTGWEIRTICDTFEGGQQFDHRVVTPPVAGAIPGISGGGPHHATTWIRSDGTGFAQRSSYYGDPSSVCPPGGWPCPASGDGAIANTPGPIAAIRDDNTYIWVSGSNRGTQPGQVMAHTTPLEWQVPARSVPTAPTLTSVVPATDGITVNWTLPTSTYYSTLDRYRLVIDPPRPDPQMLDGLDQLLPSPLHLSLKVTGLVPGVKYRFYVAAENGVGVSLPSATSASVSMLCDPATTEACPYTFGGPGDIAVPADFDGDGHADFAVFRNGVWLIDTNRDGATDRTVNFGAAGDRAYAADYNGDGHADLIIFRGTTGTWYIDTNLDGTVDTTVRYASPGDLPYIGDFNHDGHIDLGIFRPSEGNWYVDTNSDGYGDVVEHYASPGDIPAPADYDRNNTLDYAIFRPGNGCFYINDGHYHSGTTNGLPNGYATTTIGFASPGDVMAPADYNGTGTTQLAIFRPSTGVWWIRNTAWNHPRGDEATACR